MENQTHLKKIRARHMLRQGSAVNAPSIIQPVEVPACPEFIEGPSLKARISVAWRLALLTILTLQPLVAMESDGSKRQKTEVCEQQQTTIVPRPPEIPLAKELHLQPTGENLLKAAKEGNQADCSWLINQRVDVNSQNEIYLQTPLILAAQLGHYNVCELLIQHGAQVDAQNRWGITALMEAASNGHTEICELLIQHTAQVDAQNTVGETALMNAAYRGQKDVCELLIAHGAQINSSTYQTGDTALSTAAGYGHNKILKILLKHGANPNALTNDGTPVLIDSIRNDSPDFQTNPCILTLLKHGADVNLLSNGSQIDRENPQKNTGSTALMEAISELRSRETCELLLQHGADHEYTNNQGESAITLAHTRAAGGDEEGDDGDEILTLLTDQSKMQKAIINPKNHIFKRNLPGYFKDTSSSQSSPENNSEEQDDEEEEKSEKEQKEFQGDSKSICLALLNREIGRK